jgi:uncharacterized membrane protein YeaQ/YmgE (transglycosylase-associated protein family)
VHLAFDIFQGVGIAAAVGIRPFLPALAVGALAAGGVQIHFNGTDFDFLQSAAFLVGMAVGAILVLLAERRLRGREAAQRPAAAVLLGFGLALGALFFAGALAQNHYAVWAGVIAGIVCAAVGAAATGPLLSRVRSRLDSESASTLAFFAEGAAVVVAVLSVVAPPVGIIALLLLIWLLVAGRRRTGQKYAGLRILR